MVRWISIWFFVFYLFDLNNDTPQERERERGFRLRRNDFCNAPKGGRETGLF
jgi:hypothetical protein